MAVSVAAIALGNKSNRYALTLAGKIGKKTQQVTKVLELVAQIGFVSGHDFTGVPIDRFSSMGWGFSRAEKGLETMGFSP
jgi:hypothetical protein